MTMPVVCGCCFLSMLMFVVVPAADEQSVVAAEAPLLTTGEQTDPTTYYLPLLIGPASIPVAQDCTPGYSPCIAPGPDVDCHGGDGDGPRHVIGPVMVDHSFGDPYGLDRDGDGVGCEPPPLD